MQVTQNLERLTARVEAIFYLSMIPPLSKESSKLKFKATEESKPATNKELPTNKNSPDIAQKAKDLAKNHLKSETKITQVESSNDGSDKKVTQNSDDDLETLLADVKEIENWTVRYAFDKHDGLIYADKTGYGGPSGYGSHANEDLYAQMKQSLEADTTDTMSIPEAEEAMQDMQYAAVTGNFSDVDSRERERFANWALFYPELRQLFHAMYALTDNVDYSRTM